MEEDSLYYVGGIVGFMIAATVLVLGFVLGEIFEIVVIGAILLLICPMILAYPLLRE